MRHPQRLSWLLSLVFFTTVTTPVVGQPNDAQRTRSFSEVRAENPWLPTGELRKYSGHPDVQLEIRRLTEQTSSPGKAIASSPGIAVLDPEETYGVYVANASDASVHFVLLSQAADGSLDHLKLASASVATTTTERLGRFQWEESDSRRECLVLIAWTGGKIGNAAPPTPVGCFRTIVSQTFDIETLSLYRASAMPDVRKDEALNERLERNNRTRTLRMRAELFELAGFVDKAVACRKSIVSICGELYGEQDFRTLFAKRRLRLSRRLLSLSDEDRGWLTWAAFKEMQALSELNQIVFPLKPVTVGYVAGMTQRPGNRPTIRSYRRNIEIETRSSKLLLALTYRRRILGRDHWHVAQAQNNLGTIRLAAADYVSARQRFKKALQAYRRSMGQEHPYYATALNNLGRLAHETGDFVSAESKYRKAMEIRSRLLPANHLDIAASQSHMGGLMASIGDWDKSVHFHRKALEIRKSEAGVASAAVVRSLINIATAKEAQGDLEQAASLLKRAVELTPAGGARPSEGGPPPGAAERAIALNNLGAVRQSQGRHQTAELLYKDSLDVVVRLWGVRHPYAALRMQNLATLALQQGNVATGHRWCERAYEIRSEYLGTSHPDSIFSLYVLAIINRAKGDLLTATELLQSCLELTPQELADCAVIQSQRQQIRMRLMLRYQLDGYLSLALAKGDITEKAYHHVLRWKGAVLVRQRQYRQVAEEPEVAPLFEKLRQVTTQLATLSRKPPAQEGEALQGWKDRLDELTAQKEELEAQLARQSAAFRQAKEDVTIEQLRAALPQDAALVDFLEYTQSTPPKEEGDEPSSERALVAFVVRPDQPVEMFDLGPAAPVAEAVRTWRRVYGREPAGGWTQGRQAGRTLRRRLWEPLLPALEGAEMVLASPDGVLGRLPFGALPGEKPETYLIEEHRLVLLPVPQLLPGLMKSDPPQAEKGLLAMGGVDYSAAPGEPEPSSESPQSWLRPRSTAVVRGEATFPPLPATAGEVARIEDLFRDVFGAPSEAIASLEGASATEERFRELAPQCYHLHLATHGFFAPPEKKSALSGADSAEARPSRGMIYAGRERTVSGFSPYLLSGLVFAGANREPEPDRDDGILTAEEIAFLPLEGVELVTLSACETGLGKVAGGEGLLGVQRAFQISGARSTIASLWKVDDEVTRRLMERFYTNLWEKEMSKLEALREAQLWILNHPDQLRGFQADADENEPRRSPPYYWAAFQLSGDWR